MEKLIDISFTIFEFTQEFEAYSCYLLLYSVTVKYKKKL